jgi:acyl-CoA thioester hydrolase
MGGTLQRMLGPDCKLEIENFQFAFCNPHRTRVCRQGLALCRAVRFGMALGMELGKPYQGAFENNLHYFALRVYIEDTDLGGVVYHANYLRYLERARSDMLRLIGIDQRAAIESGQGVYAVTEAHVKYRKPARLDDELTVVSHLNEVGGASCVIRQKIMRGQDVVVEATITVAFLGAEGRPKRHPPEWAQKFKHMQA